MTHPKRLLKIDLPIKKISAHIRREKDTRREARPLPATEPPFVSRPLSFVGGL